MLKTEFKNCLSGIVFTCAFAFAASVYGAPEEIPVDLSILEQRNAIAKTMHPSERVALLKLEAIIDKAESDIQSAQYLVNTKPTAFRDEREVKTIVKEGEILLKKATIELDQAQRELVAYLTTAKTVYLEKQSAEAKKFSFTLNTSTYEIALETSVRELLETARNKGYKKVFYDTGFVSNESGTQEYSTTAQNQTYNTLVSLDENNSTLSAAADLHLNESANLTFDGIESYADDSLALLIIELVEVNPNDGMLSIRLQDMSNYQVIDLELTSVTEVPELIETPEAETAIEVDNMKEEVVETDIKAETVAVANTEETEAPVLLPLVTGLNIIDDGMWIDRLAAQSYNFKVVANIDDPIIPSLLLMQSIVKKTTIKIVDDTFTNRAYGSETIKASATADAEFMLSSDGEALKISATSYSNDRKLEIGSIQIKYD